MFKRLSDHWRYLLLGPMMVTVFLTPYILYNHISLSSAESLLTYLTLTVIGLIIGAFIVFGGTLIQALSGAFFIVLFVFYQVDNLPRLPFGLRYAFVGLTCTAFLSLGLYFLGKNLEKFLFVVVGVLWLGAFIHAVPPLIKVDNSETAEQADESLPPYIHIILDEHIGIEGIPSYADPERKFSNSLTKTYLDQGFRVFGRAYSRFWHTRPSFASFLNFKPVHESLPLLYSVPRPMIRPNALFEKLTEQGYIINILESNYFPYCDKESGYRLGKCINYRIDTIYPVNGPITILSGLLRKMKIRYRLNEIANALGLPQLEVTYPLDPHVTLNTFYKHIDFLSEGKKGNAYFIHLFLPHTPYFFDEKCSFRFNDRQLQYNIKDDEDYDAYLGQVKCSQKMVSDLLNKLRLGPESSPSTIIVQSDHGSRKNNLSSAPTSAFFSTEDYIQSFSAFFAVRSPIHKPEYDRRPIALDELMRTIIFGMEPLSKTGLSKFVCITESRSRVCKRFTIPPFAHGERSVKW
jgi:hypothetical protein